LIGFITKTNPLMFFSEIVTVHCDKRKNRQIHSVDKM
jgi:hypothetical protein